MSMVQVEDFTWDQMEFGIETQSKGIDIISGMNIIDADINNPIMSIVLGIDLNISHLPNLMDGVNIDVNVGIDINN